MIIGWLFQAGQGIHRARNVGVRFSNRAITASRKSSVARRRRLIMASRSRPVSSGTSNAEDRQPLGRRDRERRTGGELARPAHGLLEQSFSWNDPVDQAPRERLLRMDPAAGHDQLFRAAEPDQAWEALGAAQVGDDPPPDLVDGELRVVGGDPQVAGRGQLDPTAQGEPTDRGDGRLRSHPRTR